jgi:hypothetical protein
MPASGAFQRRCAVRSFRSWPAAAMARGRLAGDAAFRQRRFCLTARALAKPAVRARADDCRTPRCSVSSTACCDEAEMRRFSHSPGGHHFIFASKPYRRSTVHLPRQEVAEHRAKYPSGFQTEGRDLARRTGSTAGHRVQRPTFEGSPGRPSALRTVQVGRCWRRFAQTPPSH